MARLIMNRVKLQLILLAFICCTVIASWVEADIGTTGAGLASTKFSFSPKNRPK
jgi:hypothetical protein